MLSAIEMGVELAASLISPPPTVAGLRRRKYSGLRLLRTSRAGNICPYYPAVPNRQRGPKAHESRSKISRNMNLEVFIR